MLTKVLLLQFYENIFDRQAEERALYDLRWKVALHLPKEQQPETIMGDTAYGTGQVRAAMEDKKIKVIAPAPALLKAACSSKNR